MMFMVSFCYICFYSVAYQEHGRALAIAFIGSIPPPLSEQSEWAMRKIGHVWEKMGDYTKDKCISLAVKISYEN